MGLMDILKRGGKTTEIVPDFEFKTVEQLGKEYDFDFLGFLGLSTDWTKHCMELRVHEYPTLDFVKTLAKYTSERSGELLNGEERPLRVLEVAAGTGYMALGAREQLDRLHSGRGAEVVEWRAVDSNSYDYPKGILRANGVKVGDYKEELYAYRPDLVFGASIPHPEDEPLWTEEFAKAGVKEYLLAGYNEARSSDEGDALYMAFAEDGYAQLLPEDFDGTQLSIRSSRAPDSDRITTNTKTLSFRLDPLAA